MRDFALIFGETFFDELALGVVTDATNTHVCKSHSRNAMSEHIRSDDGEAVLD